MRSDWCIKPINYRSGHEPIRRALIPLFLFQKGNKKGRGEEKKEEAEARIKRMKLEKKKEKEKKKLVVVVW